MVKPLKDLLDEADRILGQTKTAGQSVTDEVSSLADTLAFASELEDQFVAVETPVETAPDTDFEKVAKVINKVAATVELEVMAKTAQFREAAETQGYTEEQVTEALSKIAAKKIRKNLTEIAALGMIPLDEINQFGGL
jgi:hypothetical protein